MLKIINFQDKIKELNPPYGSLSVDDNNYFYKIVDNHLAKLEVLGHEKLSYNYPVAKLISDYPFDNKRTALIFEYENSVGKESGLLVDLFAAEEIINNKFTNILEIYNKVFAATLREDKGESSDILFKSRVETRLKKYYDKKFISQVNGYQYNLNGRKITLDLEKILESIEVFYNNRSKTWCVLSQCDPNDLNIGTKPIVLDYLAGGWNPLMAEFATLFWYQLAQGSYLALKYNARAFKNHENIFSKIETVTFNNNQLSHQITPLRKEFTQLYIKQVIDPLMLTIGDYPNWYEEFKNFIVMKILCVFDVTKMDKEDMFLSLGYLQLFYGQEFKKPIDLMQFFEENNGK